MDGKMSVLQSICAFTGISELLCHLRYEKLD